MGKIKRAIIGMTLLIGLMNLVSAVSCSTSSYTQVYQSIPTNEITVTTNCHNPDQNNSVSFYALGGFFSLTGDNLIGAGGSKGQINILLNSEISGENIGYISFSDGTNFKINITIEDQQQTTGCRLIELPHTTNFRIRQGETSASGEIKVKASSECTDLDFNVIAQTQMNKPMYIQSKGESIPGKEYSFIIGLDAIDISTGTYSNSYTVSASAGDNVYQKTIPLSTTVTIGDSPISNSSFSDMPTCSIETNMVLNQTYKLSCTLSDPNINIEVPYNDFFIGKNVNEVSGTFEYVLEPVKIGNTNFLATFNYKGLSIGKPFEKEIRVTASETSSSGTEIEVLFYQNGEKVNIENLRTGEVTILSRDSKTKNVLDAYTIYLNGNNINSTFNLESDKNYEMIIDSPTYMSKTLNFTVQQGEFKIEIIPNKTTYKTGDTINITSNINNTKFLINDNLINTPYTFSSSGNLILKAVKEGYKTYEQNITVQNSIRYLTITPSTTEWKEGTKVKMSLNENASWEVLLDNVIIKNGQSDLVEFEITDSGNYQIKANNNLIFPGYTLEKNSWYDYLKFWTWKYYLGWVTLGLIILGLIYGYRKLFGEEDDIYSERIPERRG
ncbi:MAG: hypothetical protein ACTSXD_07120 [Candidatus Heimdallarchaeaceae archaeon]